MIARAARDIQRDWNYWFMEAQTTIPVLAGTQSYALPTDYKELIKNGLQALETTGAYYLDPIAPLLPGEGFNSFRDAVNGDAYPSFYEIFGTNILFYPILTGACTVRMRYYKFLPNPSAADFTNPVGVSNALTVACPLGISALAAMEYAGIQKEADLVQLYAQEAKDSIDILKMEDQKWRRPEVTQVRFKDL
jgi:hypothetical protein